jgi:hypothetical protein
MSRCVSRDADSQRYGRAAGVGQRSAVGGEHVAVHTHRTTSNERQASVDGSSGMTAARSTTVPASSDGPGLPRPIAGPTPEQIAPLGVHNKLMMPTATRALADPALPSRRRRIGQPLGMRALSRDEPRRRERRGPHDRSAGRLLRLCSVVSSARGQWIGNAVSATRNTPFC